MLSTKTQKIMNPRNLTDLRMRPRFKLKVASCDISFHNRECSGFV